MSRRVYVLQSANKEVLPDAVSRNCNRSASAVRRRRSGPGRRRTAEAERNRPGSGYAD